MKIVINIIGGLVVLIGAVWTLQGLDVIWGSFITARLAWAGLGSLTALSGTIWLIANNWR